MATRPNLHEAIAGQKSKASEYNDNFDKIMDYVEDSIREQDADLAATLSLYQDINTLATSGTIEPEDNTIYTITPTGAVTISLPEISGEEVNKLHQILIQVYLTNTSYLTADDEKLGTDYFFNGEKPRFPYTGYYDLIYCYDNIKTEWCVGAIFKGEE